MEVYGDDGTIVATSPGLVQWAPKRLQGGKTGGQIADLAVPERLRWIPPEVPSLQPQNVARLLRRFARAIRDGSRFEPDFATGVSLHRLLDSIQGASDGRGS